MRRKTSSKCQVPPGLPAPAPAELRRGGELGTLAGPYGVLELHVRFPNETIPARALLLEKLGELLGCVGLCLKVKAFQALGDSRCSEVSLSIPLSLVDDCPRRPGGHEDTVPLVGFEPRQDVGEWREVGQRRKPALARMAEGPQTAAGDEGDGRVCVAKVIFDLSGQQVVRRGAATSIWDVVQLDSPPFERTARARGAALRRFRPRPSSSCRGVPLPRRSPR